MAEIGFELRFRKAANPLLLLTIPSQRDIIHRPISIDKLIIAFAGSRGKKSDAGTGFLP
jgi:hypothetical protein